MMPPMTVNFSLSLAYWVDDLGGGDRIRREGDGDRALEQGVARFTDRAVQRLLGQGVLHHLELRAFLAEAATQIGHFRNGQTHVVGHDHGAGAGEYALQRFDRLPAFERGPLRSPTHDGPVAPDAGQGCRVRQAPGFKPSKTVRRKQRTSPAARQRRGRREISLSSPSPN